MFLDLQECFRVLELQPTATLEDVKRSYRELVKVWHPDRFAHDPKLQAKAQEKLKQINLAYDRICDGLSKGKRTARTSSTRTSSPKTGASTQRGSTPHDFSHRDHNSPPNRPTPPQTPSSKQPGVRKTPTIATLAVLAALIAIYAITSISRNADLQSGVTPPPSVSRHAPSRASNFTLQDFALLSNRQSNIGDFAHAIPILAPNPTAPVSHTSKTTDSLAAKVDFASDVPPVTASPRIDSFAVSSTPHEALHVQRAATQPTSNAEDFFTLGSTKDEVLAVQGTPTKISGNDFAYDYSSVRFRGGRVTSWNDISKILRTKLQPASNVQAKAFFTLGSTEDEVLAVQGTPTQVSGNEFGYDYSNVRFRGGRVTSWNDISKILRTKLQPASNVQAKAFFTLGSTEDEVLAVQGTPTQVSGNEFGYDYSNVRFRGGRVTSWNDISKILRTKLQPASNVQGKAFFTLGSTEDEVLAVQGTPTQVSENELGYDYSSVRFHGGRVISWNDISTILKTTAPARQR